MRFLSETPPPRKISSTVTFLLVTTHILGQTESFMYLTHMCLDTMYLIFEI